MRFTIVGAGGAREIDSPPESLRENEFLWCDCDYDQARAWVGPLGPLTATPIFDDHLRDAENPLHPSFFDATSGYEMIVFRGLLSSAPLIDESGALHVRTRPTVFFVFARCLVTVRAADSVLVPAVRARLLASTPSASRFPVSPEELMLRLLNAMVDRYLEQRQPLSDRLERLQRELLDARRPFRDWPALLDARSELRRLQLLCEEQLEALEGWREQRDEAEDAGSGGLEGDDQTARSPGAEPADEPAEVSALPPLSEAAKVRASDVAGHIQRVVTHARGLEHSIETAVQLHFSSTAHRTNEIMRTLTTITAIFMPLSLITGIFGMNFEFIPGLHARVGFWVAMGAMIAIAIALLVYFRARRYLTDPRSKPQPSRGSAVARRRREP